MENSILKSIKCPPSEEKIGIDKATTIWEPDFFKYAFDYTGLSMNRKSLEGNTLGKNYFMKLGDKVCDQTSSNTCRGKDMHIYVKEYPLGKMPMCSISRNGSYKTSWGPDLYGSTGIVGGIQEDIYNINTTDFAKSMIGMGPYASTRCMSAQLPVGSKLLNKDKKGSKSDGWWEEERCIPYQPTIPKNYGGKIYNIPFSSSICTTTTNSTTNSTNSTTNSTNSTNSTTNSTNSTNSKNSKNSRTILIIFLIIFLIILIIFLIILITFLTFRK